MTASRSAIAPSHWPLMAGTWTRTRVASSCSMVKGAVMRGRPREGGPVIRGRRVVVDGEPRAVPIRVHPPDAAKAEQRALQLDRERGRVEERREVQPQVAGCPLENEDLARPGALRRGRDRVHL